MPEYLSPGVYIQEVDTGTRPIEGVGTACAAFIGMAPAGRANQPVLITNWTQYIEEFGARDEKTGRRDPHMSGSYLSHSVYGYFLNGGGRCYVTRIVASSNGTRNGKAEAPAQLQLPSRAANKAPSLTVKAKTPPNSVIEVEVQAPTGEGVPEGTFTLRIRMAGADEEVYDNVGLGRRAAKNVAETVNATSKLVTVVEEQGTASLAERAPEIGTHTIPAQRQTQIEASIRADDFTGDPIERSGLEGLQIAEDVTMVSCPDLMSAYQAGILDRVAVKGIQEKMIAHCALMGDRMAILDPLPDLSPQEVKAWRESETNYDSPYAVLYYPWLKVSGPGGVQMDVPPSGYMAGIWARSDNERGVHKAPANEIVRGALGPSAPITKGEQDTLNPNGVNCIRSFTGRGVRVWGARTLSSDPAWRYINVRRLFNYVEKSIEQGTQWVVFEPNDEDLWARVRRDVSAFLTGAWREGMLFGASSAEAFFVKCDAELNPEDVRDRGQLFIDVGLAPVKPAEFVIFRLSQFAGGGA